MPATSLDDVLIVNPSGIAPATADEVAAAEEALGGRLPAGYADYVQRLGEGALGHFVVVNAPARLSATTATFRDGIRQYWFWDEQVVTQQPLAARGVALASSFDGDALCFDLADPGALFVLPRNDDIAHRVGTRFLDAIDWMLSGRLNPWVEGWSFEARNGRAETRVDLPGRTLGQAARAVHDLAEHAHVVELDARTTYFLPGIEGRLSLYQPEDEELSMDLTYAASADASAVSRILRAVGAPGA